MLALTLQQKTSYSESLRRENPKFTKTLSRSVVRRELVSIKSLGRDPWTLILSDFRLLILYSRSLLVPFKGSRSRDNSSTQTV